MTLPNDAQERKATPITTGVLDYFPDALAEVARVSKIGNDQHNPGEPLHWAKEKSQDEADSLVRHLLERGTFDTDGTRHTAKVAWRALALLQREIDAEADAPCRGERGLLPEDVPATPRPMTVWEHEDRERDKALSGTFVHGALDPAEHETVFAEVFQPGPPAPEARLPLITTEGDLS